MARCLALNGSLVSLFDMLEFAAIEFIEMSHRFGILLGNCGKVADLKDSLRTLAEHSSKLGLRVTETEIQRWTSEVIMSAPRESVTFNARERTVNASIVGEASQFRPMIESLYRIMISELQGIVFRAIPTERVKYYNQEWLMGSVLESTFPTSLRELALSGSCYAIGQPTSSVFHSMRALEPALGSLAKRFAVPFGYENWQTVIGQVESKIRDLGKTRKSDAKIEAEQFFGRAASYLYFVKNAWRNNAAHTRESYSDDEALRILQNTRDFIESISPKLSETDVVG